MSDNTDCIARNGIVDHIDDQMVYVRIQSVSACATCHAKVACTSLDVAEKLVEIDRQDAPAVVMGQQVSVRMNSGAGNQAVVYGYLLPFLILIATLAILSRFVSEALAGLIAIFALVPYFFGLYLLKDRLKRKFRFTIE